MPVKVCIDLHDLAFMVFMKTSFSRRTQGIIGCGLFGGTRYFVLSRLKRSLSFVNKTWKETGIHALEQGQIMKQIQDGYLRNSRYMSNLQDFGTEGEKGEISKP